MLRRDMLGREQQQRNVGSLLGTVAREARGAVECDLRQRVGASRRGGKRTAEKVGLNLRLIRLPGYSPNFNANEIIWGQAREEATGNLCLWSRTAVQDKVGGILRGQVSRKDEVRRRCWTVLQSRADALRRRPITIPTVKQMHISLWIWFRSRELPRRDPQGADGLLRDRKESVRGSDEYTRAEMRCGVASTGKL